MELEKMLKVNKMALSWKLKRIELMINSMIVLDSIFVVGISGYVQKKSRRPFPLVSETVSERDLHFAVICFITL